MNIRSTNRGSVRLATKYAAGLFALALVASAGLVSGASAASNPNAVVRGGTLTVAQVSGAAVPGLDVFGPSNSALIQEYSAVYDPLFFPDFASGGVFPALALSYKTSNAGKTITIQLRKGVKFSDGTPFNADAALFNIRRSADPAQDSECLGDLSWFTSAKALGPYTVQVQFSRPDPTYISLISQVQCGYMESPTAVTAEGTQYGLHPVGTGPFVQTSFVANSTWDFTANPSYWQKGYPLLHGLNFIYFGTSAAADACVASGQCQLFTDTSSKGPSVLDISGYYNNPSVKFYKVLNTASTSDIQLNVATAPFSNLNARVAMAEAINEQQIISSIYTSSNGVRTMIPAEGPIPPGSWAYPGPNVGYPKYTPTAAASLVSSMGGLSFTLDESNTAIGETLGAAVQAQLQAVGMKVTLLPEAAAAEQTQLHSGSFTAVLLAYPAPIPPLDPDLAIGDSLYTPNPKNQSHIDDPKLNALVLKSENSFNRSYRAAAYKQMAIEFDKELPWVVIGNTTPYEEANASLFHGVAVPWNSKGTPQQNQYNPWYSYWVS